MSKIMRRPILSLSLARSQVVPTHKHSTSSLLPTFFSLIPLSLTLVTAVVAAADAVAVPATRREREREREGTRREQVAFQSILFLSFSSSKT